ncbi:uncharacterized protein LOC131605670 [Vicia villosa]|uniref:uncharacterized protein LOC131605670 n=1 Tax=Vicia villosa TaxID=3911 RepID=UPI00273AB9CD|nr:uncharacterized protein LOC131605670 [Vicia villosa]
MNTVFNDRVPTNLPTLDGKNYSKCSKQMKVLCGYQDILEVIKNGVGDCESTKQVWEILEKSYAVADKAKVYCGEAISEQNVVSKILRSLTPRFDNIVVAIEESKDLLSLSKKELQSFLEAHEQRMDERSNDKAKEEVALQARFNEKSKKSKGKWLVKNKGNFQKFGGKDSQNSILRIKGLGHFARDCNEKQREHQCDEAKVSRQELDEENILLVMITEGYCSISELLDDSSSSGNVAEMCAEENIMVTVRDRAQGSKEWYSDSS